MEKPLPPLRHSLAFIVPAEHIRFACHGHAPPQKSPSSATARCLLFTAFLIHWTQKAVITMNTKDILRQLRVQKGLSQDELAEKLYVTRQAVSRWETGETTPNVETLKLLSRFLMSPSTPCWALPEHWSASAAGCHWTMRASAASWTARSTRTTANGATTTARSSTKARSSSSISASNTWPPKLGPKSRFAPTWKRSFPYSSTGNNKTRGRRPTQERLPLVLFRAVAEQPNLETQ